MSSRKDNYFSILDTGNMFEDSGHRTRFKELLDCYGDFPFFSKGLCKCMYLSAWDEEHFCIMLEILTDLSLGRETSTREMRVKGEALADAFLDNAPYRLPEAAEVPPEILRIISRALQAAELIDQA